MTFIPTIWTDGDFIPKKGLIAWHAADTTDTAQTIEDAGGLGLTIDSGVLSNPPDLTPDVTNGLPALVFDGSTHDPLLWEGVIPAVRHAFVIAAHADAAFPAGDLGNGGLLTGVESGDVLVGNVSSTRFFDFNFDSLGAYSYKRRDVAFAESNMQCSFNSAVSIFEVSLDIGFALDGIQVGRQKNVAARLWKGPWHEHILYSEIKTGTELQRIYEYIAMKYLLWRQVASGLNVWPFQPDFARPLANDKLVLRSQTVAGTTKARSKSAAKKAFEAGFGDREPEEYNAAEAFWDEHYPGTSLIYRDDGFTPSRDTEVLITSPFAGQQSSHRSLVYSLQMVEV